MFAKLRAAYRAAISRIFEYKDSCKRFEFGGWEQTKGQRKVKLSFYILDVEDEVTPLNI